MATVDSGVDFVTELPFMSEDADIQEALRYFLYGTLANADAPVGTLVSEDGSNGLTGHLNVMKQVSDSKLSLTGGTVTGQTTFSNATQSTAPTSGAVKISGGLGVALNLNIGGALDVTGSSQFDGAVNSASSITAAGTITSTSAVASPVSRIVATGPHHAYLILDAPDGQNDYILFKKDDEVKWLIVDDSADNFKLSRYNSGSPVDNPIQVSPGTASVGSADIDFTGSVLVSDGITSESTENSTTASNGSVTIAGGMGVAQDVNVGGDLDVTGTITNTEVQANTTHRTSTGVDHSYIDQSVTTTASPMFSALNVSGTITNTEIQANTTHRTSTGVDHSYIDQSVTITSSPTFGALDVSGDLTTSGVVRKAVVETSSYTIVDTDHIVIADGASAKTFTLPLATWGREFIIKCHGAGLLTIQTTSSQLIDGTLKLYLGRYDSVTLSGRGTAWMVV